MNNPAWSMTTQATGLLFTSTTTIQASVDAGLGFGRSRIVLTSAGIQAGAKAGITVNISSLSGGEIRTNNNSVVLSQSVQR